MKQSDGIVGNLPIRMRSLATVIACSFCLLSCTSLPEADSFAAPQMGSIEVVEAGAFGLKLKCDLEGPGNIAEIENGAFENGSSATEYGFYLEREGQAEVLTVNGTISSSYTIVATATGLSSGTEYSCRAVARKG